MGNTTERVEIDPSLHFTTFTVEEYEELKERVESAKGGKSILPRVATLMTEYRTHLEYLYFTINKWSDSKNPIGAELSKIEKLLGYVPGKDDQTLTKEGWD